MSVNFSANQYEKNFEPVSLQNWQVPKEFGKRPHTRAGCTEIIANNRGHMDRGVPRSRRSPWGSYVGTWDMPVPLPGNRMMNTTARSEKVIEKLQRCKTDGDIVLCGALKPCHLPSPLPVRADAEADVEVVHTMDAKPLTPLAYSPGIPPPDPVISSDSGPRSGAKNPSPLSRPTSSGNGKKSISTIRWPCPTEPQRPVSAHKEYSHESIPEIPSQPGYHVLPGVPISPSREKSPPQQITPVIGNEPELAHLNHSPNLDWPVPKA